MKTHKNQRGEIVTILTIISLGLMLMGIVAGKIAVQQTTQTQSKACDLEDYACRHPQPTSVPDTQAPQATAVPVAATVEPAATTAPTDAPQPTTVPPTPIPNTPVPTRSEPLPGHSRIDCGGPPNQCNPATDDPKICGNDGCLHAAVGRPTGAPTLAPPTGQIFPTLPGRKPTDCGGTFYQCNNPGSGSCGNDGCDNDKLGRPYNHPLPTLPGATPTLIPGNTDALCGGRYYQCVKGAPDCATDGCDDRLLGRGKYSYLYLTLTPAAPTPIPFSITYMNQLCTKQFGGRGGGIRIENRCIWCVNEALNSSEGFEVAISTCNGEAKKIFDCKDTSLKIIPGSPGLYLKDNRCFSCNISDVVEILPAKCSEYLTPTPAAPAPTLKPKPCGTGRTCIMSFASSCSDKTFSDLCISDNNEFNGHSICCHPMAPTPTPLPPTPMIILPTPMIILPTPTIYLSPTPPPNTPSQGTGNYCRSQNNLYIVCNFGIPPTCSRCSSSTPKCISTGFLSAKCVDLTPTPGANARLDELPNPVMASTDAWAKVQTLAVEGKYNAKQISTWVYEAAKYYYPGVKMKFCEPSRGECDFRL